MQFSPCHCTCTFSFWETCQCLIVFQRFSRRIAGSVRANHSSVLRLLNSSSRVTPSELAGALDPSGVTIDQRQANQFREKEQLRLLQAASQASAGSARKSPHAMSIYHSPFPKRINPMTAFRLTVMSILVSHLVKDLRVYAQIRYQLRDMALRVSCLPFSGAIS